MTPAVLAGARAAAARETPAPQAPVRETPAPQAPALDADFVFASGGTLVSGERGPDIALPALADAGPGRIGRLALEALADRPGSLACGLVPFDPAQAPRLFVVQQPVRRRFDGATASAPAPVVESVAASAGDAAAPPEATDERYQRAVAAALERIAEGPLRKVVLARHLEVDVRGLDAGVVWARLAARNPHGYTFAVREGADVFLGASPELVAAIDESGFATHPLAGSSPRDGSAARDAARGSALLASQKDRREHGFVVDHIVARLAPLLGRLDVPSAPGLFATDAMLHLGTRVTGTLRPGVSCLEAALTIHPTPAVCGVPSARALDEIRRLEPAGRDCYAGLVGWMDARGHGQWALALRCALLRAGRARLYAGAGVVAGSVPEAEHAETAAKFATMTAALAPPRETPPAGGPR